MLKKLLNAQSKTITSAAIILGAASLFSRLLGVLRDRVLAGQFGAGGELDAYYAAFRVPDLVFNLIIVGALAAGFIPVFSGYLNDKKKAWELVNVVLNIMSLVIIGVSVLFGLLAPWLAKIVAPGFSPQHLALTANLTRVMFISSIFLGVSGIFGSVLQSFRRFFIYSLAPILYNIGIIFDALFFTKSFGVMGLAWGVALGAGLHMAIQIIATADLGYRWRPVLDLNHKGLRQIFSLMLPRTMGLIIAQINFFIITIIGSSLASGSIAVFNFANNIQSFPLGLFGVSFAIAVFPTLTELVPKRKQFIDALSLAVRQILFLIIPSSILLIVLRAQVVRIILGSGRFDWEDTVLTLETLSFFAVSLFAQSLNLVLARAFYAHHDSKTPFYSGLVAVATNIILAVMLVDQFGVIGLALAFSLSTIFDFFLMTLLLHHKLGKLDGQRIISSITKILVASFMLGLSAWAAKIYLGQIFGTDTFVSVMLQGIGACLIGSAVYLGTGWLLHSEELTLFLNSFKNKFIKPKVAVEDIIASDSLTQ